MTTAAVSTTDGDQNSSLVELTDVTKRYTRGTEPGRLGTLLGRSEPPTVTAVDSVSLAIKEGEVVGLAGPSGSGKSTVLHLIAGLELQTAGTVAFRGTALGEWSERDRTRHRLEHVGIVFQHFHLLDSLSARANVALPLVELGVPKGERRRRASELLDQVGLEDRRTHRPRELSGGEQQRVAIARALVTDPTLVIADEPTGELDTETGAQILNMLSQLGDERAVVVASHDANALSVCDRVIRLRDGSRVE